MTGAQAKYLRLLCEEAGAAGLLLYWVLAWSDARSNAYLDPVFHKAVENQLTKVVVQRGFTNTINVRAIAP